MIYIGIDPGAKGGIAYINTETGKSGKAQTPTLGGDVDIQKFCEFIKSLTKGEHMVIVEDVHSVFGASAKANFTFGGNVMGIEWALVALGCKYLKVAPKVWQKEMWTGVSIVKINTGKKTKDGNIKYKNDTKATSLIAAKRLFPKEDFLATVRSKIPHDGIVDALLLAEYGKRKF